MAGPHVEPAQERSVDARIKRLRERVKGAMRQAQASGESAGPYIMLLGVLDLLDTEL